MTTLHGPPLETFPGIGALTMGGFFEEVCARFDDNEALVFDDPLRDGATVRWTYADLRNQGRRVAKALAAAPEDAKVPLQQRLELYKAKKPYRQSAETIRP